MLDEKTRSSLGESIAKCIETVLNSNYGEDISPVIFYAYKARFGLVKSDIISHAEEFEEILEDIFGTGIASQMINRTICLALGRQFEIDLIESGDSIATVIKRIVARADERAS